MEDWIVEVVACPVCQSCLSPDGANSAERTLTCGSGHQYPVRDGIPRLLPPAGAQGGASEVLTRQVRDRFEFQWRKWGREERLFGQTDDQMAARLVGEYVAGVLSPDFYPGRRVLDAGCGHGRYLPAFRRFGAHVVGMDFGSGIEGARTVAGADPGLALVQGDVSHPPFQDNSFDLVFAFGVLQFTSDPRQAFLSLARRVKPGGYLYIWVYPREGRLWQLTQRAIRAVTTRLPPPLLYPLCFVPVPLLSFVSTYSGTSLRNSSWKQCAQVIWDWYSPRQQTHHTAGEVVGWYRDAGFEEAVLLPVRIGAIGRKRT